MPRCGRIRQYVSELEESPSAEKIYFILPIIILITEAILLEYALNHSEHPYVIFLTSFLLIISVIELLLVGREIHIHRSQTTRERELAIRLDDFILERQMDNVSLIVKDFLDECPEFTNKRTMIYHIACQIMETHKQELWEKTLRKRMKIYLKNTKKTSIREIVDAFIKKYPNYKKDPEKVYQLVAQLIDKKQ